MKPRRSEPSPTALFLTDAFQRRRSGRKAAVSVSAFLLVLALLLSGCGGDREEKAAALTRKGVAALKQRRAEAAREYFRRALELQPDQPAANYALARVLDQYFCDTAAALIYYRRFMDVAGESGNQEASLAAIKMLERMTNGTLEDPAAAADDLLAAAYGGRREVFYERLAGSLIHDQVVSGKKPERLMSQLGAYSLGGKPEVVYRKVTGDGQAGVVVVRLRSESDAVVQYICLLFTPGQGEYAGLWQLAQLEPVKSIGKAG